MGGSRLEACLVGTCCPFFVISRVKSGMHLNDGARFALKPIELLMAVTLLNIDQHFSRFNLLEWKLLVVAALVESQDIASIYSLLYEGSLIVPPPLIIFFILLLILLFSYLFADYESFALRVPGRVGDRRSRGNSLRIPISVIWLP